MRVKDCPQCRWVPVVDAAGRRRLEMRWGSQAAVAAPSARGELEESAQAA